MPKSTSSKILGGMVWKFAERTSAQLVSFILSIFLARLLLPSEFGAVALILVFITIADVFVSSGFAASLIQKKDANEVDFSSIFHCSFVVSLIVYIILYFFAPLIADFFKIPELALYLRVLSVKIIISSYNSVQHAYVSRHMQFKKFFFSTIIGTILSGIAGIFLAFKGAGAWALIIQYLLNSLINSIVLSFTVSWHPKFIFSWTSTKSLMSFGWKVLLTDLMGTFFDNLRSMLIGRFYTSTDLAFYNKGRLFPSIIGNNIDSTLTSVLFPAMSNVSNNVEKVKQYTRKSMQVSSYVMFSLMAILVAMAKPLVLILLTEKWVGCVIFLQILCISQSASTISRANIQAIKALGRSDVTLKLELVKKPIFILFLLLSIHLGVVAIAISMSLYSVVATALNMLPNKKLMSYSFFEQICDILPSILLALLVGVAVYFVQLFSLNIYLTFVLQCIVSIALFFFISFVFKFKSLFILINAIKGLINR